jgi:hypothetical protein
MKITVALFFVVLLLGARAHAADADACAVSEDLIQTDHPVTRVADAIAAKRLGIAVVGTASSTLRAPQNAYPAQLQPELKRRLPDVAVELKTHIESNGTTADMAATFPKLVAEDKPDLMIWQTRTVDLMLGNGEEELRAALESGIGALQSAKTDVMVVNLQYSPRTDPMTDAKAFADVMPTVTEDRNVLLFNRMGIMKYWSDAGTFDFYSLTDDGATNRVHACLGRLLADLVVGSAKPGDGKADN